MRLVFYILLLVLYHLFFLLFFIAYLGPFGALLFMVLLIRKLVQYAKEVIEKKILIFLEDGRKHVDEILAHLKPTTGSDEKTICILNGLEQKEKIQRTTTNQGTYYQLAHEDPKFPGKGKRTKFKLPKLFPKPT